jgi:pilus assembly protein FimV
MQNLIAVTHDPLAAAAALGDLFGKHGRAQEGAKEMVVAAEALVERGSTDDAREVLNRALILAPGFDAAVGRLAELEGAGAAPAGIPSAAPEPEPEPGGGMFAVELESPALEEEAPPPPPPHREEPAVREDPAVASALSEVEVLIKYGLVPKAIEQLEGVVQRFPGVSRVRARLLELYRDQKLTDKAVIQALMLAEIYEQQGQQDESRSVLRSALELAPGNLQIMAKLGMAAPEPESVETIEEPEAIEEIAEIPEVPEEIPELAVPELDMEMPSEVSELEMAEEPEETAGIGFEEEAPVEAPAAGPARGRRYEPPREEKVFEEEAPLEEAFPETEPLADTEVSELWAEAEFYYQQGLFDEARKCYERVLEQRPNDQKAMGRIVEITREKEDVAEFTRLSEEVKSLERMIQAGPGEVEESVSQTDVDAVRSLMQEITDLRKGPSAPPKQPAREREPAAAQEDFTEQSFAGITEESEDLPSGEKQAAEDSFADLSEELSGREPTAPFSGDGNTVEGRPSSDESADFFDLAAELRDELSTTTASTPSPSLHEQSIDEIFEEFKAGVEAHEKKEDEDTHYNLGVAYREMGLLDDAISEFNMTNEGEPKFIQSRYMLGLCYLENGDYETAILEIQNALGYSYSFGEASDERISMHYDLGLAYQGIGNTQSALEELQKVHAIDPSYREVSTKIKELEEGEFISLDAIKEDIEKEISFKFLEEGARIEREEKTKPKKTKK